MTTTRRSFVATLLGLPFGLNALASHAQAAKWPARPVRWIVPFAPGGPGDVTARIVTQKLAGIWGQAVMVDNKPGANTIIAAMETVRSAPDGYTLFQPMNSTMTVNPFAMSKVPYDPVSSFSHIGVMTSVPLLVVANDTLPAKDIAGMIALAKAKPGTINVGGGNVGQQLAAERFARDAGVKLQYIPYKSGSDVTKALLGGEIQAGFDGVPAYPTLLKEGRLRALATNSPTRISLLPDVPTLAELGLKRSEAPIWHALVGPAGLPAEIKDKIARDVQTVLAMPDVKDKLGTLGMEPTWKPEGEFVELIKSEAATMGPIVKDLGIKMDS